MNFPRKTTPTDKQDVRAVVTEFYSKRAIHYDKDKSGTTLVGNPIMACVCNLFEVAGIRTNQLCLDVGAGTGRFTIRLQEIFGARFIGLDLSLEMLEVFARKVDQKPELVCADGSNLPFVSHTIDLILTTWCLHLFEPTILINEFSRVLTGGGFMLIGDTVLHPFDDIDFHNRVAHAVGPVPGAFYGADQIAAMLAKQGYKILHKRIVPYRRQFDELFAYKAKHYSGQGESFAQVIHSAPRYIREIYQIESESITWFFAAILAQKSPP